MMNMWVILSLFQFVVGMAFIYTMLVLQEREIKRKIDLELTEMRQKQEAFLSAWMHKVAGDDD